MVAIRLNGEPKTLADDTTVRDLLDGLGLGDQPVAVEVNRQVITKTTFSSRTIVDRDEVEIVTIVGGG